MENVVLTVHLILALCLIGVVLLQRNDGGGGLLGGGGAITGRAAQTPLGKLTWAFAIAFIATSLAMTVIAAQNSADTSVLDRITDAPLVPDTGTGPTAGSGAVVPPAEDLLPPALGDGPLLPPPPAD
jgi:preprotein translocase subunit SecG